MDYAKLGAAALQTEESFANVTSSYGVNGDKLLAKMKEVSAGVIDNSDLMQRALKALQQGLSAEQIVNLLEVSRSSARVAGTDIVSAFDSITNAVANQTTRALKLYGIMIDNNKAFEDYARILGISKDALTEQQQSQALANAAIIEGQRQMKAMGEITLNATEKFQAAEAQLHEFKETIGKGIIIAIQSLGGVMYWLAGAGLTVASALMKVGAGILYTTGRFKEARQLSEDANAMFEAAGEVAGKGMKLWEGISLATAEAAEATKGLAKVQQDAANAATVAASQRKEAAELAISTKKAELKTFEDAMNYEIALEKQQYDQGKATLQEYLAFVKEKQEAHLRDMIALKQMELAAVQEDPKLSDTDRAKQTAEIEEEIKQIKIKSSADQLKIEQDLTEGLKKEHTTDFDSWKSLQELKTQSLKSSLDLQNTIEETMVKQGLLRQSDLLQNQIDRQRQFYDQKIAIAEETMQRIAELESQDLTKDERDKLQEEYRKAYGEREDLQRQWAGQVLQSEENIAEAIKKEQTDATAFVAALTHDRVALDALEYQQKLDQLDKYHAQGLISEENYSKALEVIEKQTTDDFREELRSRTEQLNLAMDIIADRRHKLESTLKGMYTDSFDDVKQYFDRWGDALSTDVDDMQNQIDQFMQHTTWTSYDTFWNASLYGRRLIEMAGTSIFEWSQRVADYIQHIKTEMASLDDTINGLRIQLAQLKGDRLAELEMENAQQRKKIEDQYKDVAKTQEYYEALALLDEIYKEKKKKILDEMAKDEEDSKSKSGGSAAGGVGGGGGSSVGGSSSGGSGSGIIVPPSGELVGNLVASITEGLRGSAAAISAALAGTEGLIPKEIKLSKDLTITANLDVKASDKDYINRLFEDDLWPLFKRKFELIGVKF